jgi:hypothetical protein
MTISEKIRVALWRFYSFISVIINWFQFGPPDFATKIKRIYVIAFNEKPVVYFIGTLVRRQVNGVSPDWLEHNWRSNLDY